MPLLLRVDTPPDHPRADSSVGAQDGGSPHDMPSSEGVTAAALMAVAPGEGRSGHEQRRTVIRRR
jgi:hypothetical protein